MATDKKLLTDYLASLNVKISDKTADCLASFSEKVLNANRQFNLTAITEEPDFTEKHLIDSLAAADMIPFGASICDIGAGAGFPSVPLAAARHDITVTALDSTAKKTSFLKRAAEELGLVNLRVRNARAEDCADLRETFDCACARAVAVLPILLELAFPLLKTGGLFFAYKTDKSEMLQAARALNVLNGDLTAEKHFTLPSGDSRCIMVFRKTKPTPDEYPRPYAAIKKSPL